MPLLTKTEARAYLGGISQRSLDRLTADGRLPYVAVGGRVRAGRVMFDRADLDAFIEANKTYRVEDAS